jgi:hypothetical protein
MTGRCEVGERLLAAAYGWRVPAAAGDPWLALQGADHWPKLELEVAPDRLGERMCRITNVDAGSGDTRALVPEPAPGELAHPMLGHVAVALALQSPLTALHGGAFAAGGGAWLVPGVGMLGKSTVLAALAVSGVGVLCEDVIVIRDQRVLSGPRLIDLRLDSARALGVEGTTVRREGRRRLALRPIAAELPVAGVVHLRRDDTAAGNVRCLAASEALGALSRLASAGGVVAGADAQLELAALPTYELAMPRRWERLRPAVTGLLGAILGDGALARGS